MSRYNVGVHNVTSFYSVSDMLGKLERDIISPSEIAILFLVAKQRYVAFGNEESIIALPISCPAGHIERDRVISSDASAAHIDVKFACETYDDFECCFFR